MRAAPLLIAVSLLGAAVRAEEGCPIGQAWDPVMVMCMPVAPLTNPPQAGGLPSPSEPLHLEHMSHYGHMHEMSNAGMYDMMISPDGCGVNEYYVFGMSMCEPRPEMRFRFSGMVMGNLALTDTGVAGPRSRHSIAAPNWLMADGGLDLASWNRLELDLMLTTELWTFPRRGYALPLQIGEENAAGQPYIDSQHPHSSPLMGLTLTDVISFSSTRTRILRVWFSPRGETTDGPIAFMHRATGTVNPDAPLGHHVGQDVGHVTSTVIGASFTWTSRIGQTAIEASTFHGREPSPTEIDLPISNPDSGALRVVQQFGRHLVAALSVAYVTSPEGDGADTVRVSASAYTQHRLGGSGRWRAHSTWIWGGVSNYDHATFLTSFGFEASFSDEANTPFARLEVLQRTPGELGIASPNPNDPQFVGSLTFGYVRHIVSLWGFDLGIGASGSLGFVPGDYQAQYGGPVIASGKLFLDLRFIKMWSLGAR